MGQKLRIILYRRLYCSPDRNFSFALSLASVEFYMPLNTPLLQILYSKNDPKATRTSIDPKLITQYVVAVVGSCYATGVVVTG